MGTHAAEVTRAQALLAALEVAARLCIEFEGFYASPYLCPAGVPTIGYGSTYYADGRMVTLDDPPLTEPEARHLLMDTLRRVYAAGVIQASPVLIRYPQIWGAMTDFAYNLGVPRYRASTLRKRVEAEDWPATQRELMRWTRAGGRVLKGLVRRREAEAAWVDSAP